MKILRNPSLEPTRTIPLNSNSFLFKPEEVIHPFALGVAMPLGKVPGRPTDHPRAYVKIINTCGPVDSVPPTDFQRQYLQKRKREEMIAEPMEIGTDDSDGIKQDDLYGLLGIRSGDACAINNQDLEV